MFLIRDERETPVDISVCVRSGGLTSVFMSQSTTPLMNICIVVLGNQVSCFMHISLPRQLFPFSRTRFPCCIEIVQLPPFTGMMLGLQFGCMWTVWFE